MQLSDQSKKSLLIGIAASFVLAILFVPYFVRAPLTDDSALLPATPIGTDQLTIGANLYLSNGYHFGKVVKLDQRHEFPDGTNRPGVLIKPTNTFAIWVPVEKLTNAMVVQ